ncbi:MULTISPECIES: hypothetical protein [Aliivibrio]|uniref:Uncharacterized protein n=3 Tax=Aliivibrio TaxID=511678 RepID=A0A1B9NUB7_ALILO|nr:MULTISPECIES: hypothetical protein [Aliivibrio]MBB1312440.1 hypothetical protein [Aliivibrio sp. SR45-2]AZL85290.1 hypothetical protein EIJ81_12395 [Aliivibrio salmonicida]OCH17617.1 hypothetical protein A6E04_18520 [Aliivibrio logei]OEF18981.1 hypothetical protein A1Q5_18685 [Aliivibrio logei 5S-186]CAQ79809.1 hypothetical protein VSAL_I2124 [Aliivibrio salmonicida LFI1238]
MTVDINIIYSILVSWNKPKTYSDLTQDYKCRTGEWYSPQSWNEVLSQLNKILAEADAPPLSALVVSQSTNEPGALFWASASNVPPKHNNPLKRTLMWQGILNQVVTYQWPNKLPIN